MPKWPRDFGPKMGTFPIEIRIRGPLSGCYVSTRFIPNAGKSELSAVGRVQLEEQTGKELPGGPGKWNGNSIQAKKDNGNFEEEHNSRQDEEIAEYEHNSATHAFSASAYEKKSEYPFHCDPISFYRPKWRQSEYRSRLTNCSGISTAKNGPTDVP